MLDEDVLVVADAVLDGVDHVVGHRPPGALVERDRGQVVDPGVQLEVGVAGVGDRRFTQREQAPTEA